MKRVKTPLWKLAEILDSLVKVEARQWEEHELEGFRHHCLNTAKTLRDSSYNDDPCFAAGVFETIAEEVRKYKTHLTRK